MATVENSDNVAIGLRQRHVGDRVSIDTESGRDLLDTQDSTKKRLSAIAAKVYAFARSAVYYIWHWLVRIYRWLDQFASIIVGNEMQWIGTMSSDRFEQLNDWYIRHRRLLRIYALVVFAVSAAFYISIIALLMMFGGATQNAHIFVPQDAAAVSYSTVYEVPADFSCMCRTLTSAELEDNVVYRDDASILNNEDSSTLVKTTLAGVLAMNEALLDPTRGDGCSIAAPKLWNTTNTEDLLFIDSGHRFNPCVVSVMTLESGVVHMINPVIVNEHMGDDETSTSNALEMRPARESVNAFGFLMNGVISDRFTRVHVRYRTWPHATRVQVREFNGVDAIIVQAGVQLITDGYKSAIERARGATEKWKRRHPGHDLVRERVRFDINSQILTFEMDTTVSIEASE